jgi:hypothetical protein
VIPARLERATHSLEGCCSIQLSYGTKLFLMNTRPIPHTRDCSIQLSYGTKLFLMNTRSIPHTRDCSIQLSYGTKLFLMNTRPIPHTRDCSIQLSYGTIFRLQNYIFFQMIQENTSPFPLQSGKPVPIRFALGISSRSAGLNNQVKFYNDFM